MKTRICLSGCSDGLVGINDANVGYGPGSTFSTFIFFKNLGS